MSHPSQKLNVGFSSATLQVLSRYDPEQSQRIVSFFGQMVKNFSSTFTHIYGSEPDETFAAFASTLTRDEAVRIVMHLRERIAEGKEWPPAVGMLSAFRSLPLTNEILEARHRLCVTNNPQTPVEIYIASHKREWLRNLSQAEFAKEFRILFTQAYKEVNEGYDKQIEAIAQSYKPMPPQKTSLDIEIDRRAQQGVEFQGKIGEIMARVKVKQMERSS